MKISDVYKNRNTQGKSYLLADDKKPGMFFARRYEDEVKADVVKGMNVGEVRDLGNGFTITREK